jgi:hypothetical protein
LVNVWFLWQRCVTMPLVSSNAITASNEFGIRSAFIKPGVDCWELEPFTNEPYHSYRAQSHEQANQAQSVNTPFRVPSFPALAPFEALITQVAAALFSEFFAASPHPLILDTRLCALFISQTHWYLMSIPDTATSYAIFSTNIFKQPPSKFHQIEQCRTKEVNTHHHCHSGHLLRAQPTSWYWDSRVLWEMEEWLQTIVRHQSLSSQHLSIIQLVYHRKKRAPWKSHVSQLYALSTLPPLTIYVSRSQVIF